MRVAVLADIHGNLPALEAVLADSQKRRTDRIIVAGDLVGGPQPDPVVDRLRERDAVMIRGNNEAYLLAIASDTAPEEWSTRKQWAYMRHTRLLTSQQTIDFIATLPEQRVVAFPGTDPIRVVHGSPSGISDGIYPHKDPDKLDEILPNVSEPVLIAGHTHHPWAETRHNTLALNPGSAGSSCNGDPRACYAILEWRDDRWQVDHHLVAYDVAAVRTAFVETGLLTADSGFSRSALLCIETGHPVASELVKHAYAEARKTGYKANGLLPDDLWEQAVESFAWEKWERRKRTFTPSRSANPPGSSSG